MRDGSQRPVHSFRAERLAVTLGLEVQRHMNGLAGLREQAETDGMPHYSTLSRAASQPSHSPWAKALLQIPAVREASPDLSRADVEIVPLAVSQVIAATFAGGGQPSLEALLNSHAREEAEARVAMIEALADGRFTTEEKERVAKELHDEGAALQALARRLTQEATEARARA